MARPNDIIIGKYLNNNIYPLFCDIGIIEKKKDFFL